MERRKKEVGSQGMCEIRKELHKNKNKNKKLEILDQIKTLMGRMELILNS